MSARIVAASAVPCSPSSYGLAMGGAVLDGGAAFDRSCSAGWLSGMGAIGNLGYGFGSPGLSGRIVSGVTITTISVLDFLRSLLLNRTPRIGILARPGSFENDCCARSS